LIFFNKLLHEKLIPNLILMQNSILYHQVCSLMIYYTFNQYICYFIFINLLMKKCF